MPTVPDLDLARIRQFCERRVPAHLRDEARVEADTRGKSVTIFDCRPPWHPLQRTHRLGTPHHPRRLTDRALGYLGAT